MASGLSGEPIPSALSALVRQCLSKSAADRPQSMVALSESLREVLALLEPPSRDSAQVAAPVVAGSFIDPGPARLHFRGRDHFLSGSVFTLGRAPDCSLIFESDLYPTVSARHCDIFLDRRTYMLRDRSRYGTLINERPVRQHHRNKQRSHSDSPCPPAHQPKPRA